MRPSLLNNENPYTLYMETGMFLCHAMGRPDCLASRAPINNPSQQFRDTSDEIDEMHNAIHGITSIKHHKLIVGVKLKKYQCAVIE